MNKAISSLIVGCVCISACSVTPYRSDTKKQTLRVPRGWYFARHTIPIQYVKAEEDIVGYRLYIDRSNSKEDMDYLHKAESIFPKRERLKPHQSSIHQSRLRNWYFERLWWHEEYQNFRIPFSVTSDTLKYYIEQYAQIKKKIKKEKEVQTWKGANKNRVYLEYTGKVKRGNEPERQTIVTLTIKWYLFCGQRCGWGFEKNRTVYFDSSQHIGNITGDGVTTKWISSPEAPYAPHQWITF